MSYIWRCSSQTKTASTGLSSVLRRCWEIFCNLLNKMGRRGWKDSNNQRWLWPLISQNGTWILALINVIFRSYGCVDRWAQQPTTTTKARRTVKLPVRVKQSWDFVLPSLAFWQLLENEVRVKIMLTLLKLLLSILLFLLIASFKRRTS